MTKVIIIQRVLEVIDYLFISFFKRFNEREKNKVENAILRNL